MKRKSRKQRQRRQAILVVGVVALIGMIWSIYELFSLSVSAELTVPPIKNTAMQQETSQRYKVVIDAGHGGKDPGADGVSGNQERAYTLALSKKVFDLLQQEPMFEAYMTRTDDTSVNLDDRINFANDLDADAFVSIHGNTYTDPDVNGTETYYYADDSIPFANEVHEHLVEATGFKDRGVRKEGWKVLTESNNLAILLEVGFLTNQSDETNMLNDSHQDRTAQGIVKGIKEYFADREDSLSVSAELADPPIKNTAMQQETSQRYKVVIDAGHGGKDPGADGVSGNQERAYTLALSKKVFDLLQQEPMFEAYMTRTDDTSVNLDDRINFANDLDADAFVSIHGNTYTDPDVNGTETYYYADDSIPFANEVHEHLVEAAGFKDRGVRKEGWKVLTESNNLAILLEVGYLTNPSDEMNMLSDSHQDRMAQGIVEGIKEYFADTEN